MTILCTHTVDPQWDSPLALDPDAFDAHCAWLVRNKEVVDLDRALALLDADQRLPPGVVTITFDDGFASFYDHAFPILQRHGLPATVFLVSATLTPPGQVVDWIDAPPATPPATLSLEQILEMQEAGIRFESHSHHHTILTSLSEDECVDDLTTSRQVLEDLLGRRIDTLAYPRGRHDAHVRRAAERAGFRYAFSLPEQAEEPEPLAIPRVGLYPGNGVRALQIKSSRWYLPLRTSAPYASLRRHVLARDRRPVMASGGDA